MIALLLTLAILFVHPYGGHGYTGAMVGDCSRANVGVNISSPIGPYAYVDEC